MNKIMISLCLTLWALALSAQTHFSFNYRQFQNDMAIYFMLNDNGRAVSNLNNYEVAAFVGDECRGIATFESQTGSNGSKLTYGYLRVYSNVNSGEELNFKIYNKSTNEEMEVDNTSIPFVANTNVGYPSSPQVFEISEGTVLMGDVDGDGRITINDAVLTISATFGTDPTGFNRLAADMDGDGRVTINDVVLIINQTF